MLATPRVIHVIILLAVPKAIIDILLVSCSHLQQKQRQAGDDY